MANFITTDMVYNNDRKTHRSIREVPFFNAEELAENDGFVKYEEVITHETMSVTISMISSGDTSKVLTADVMTKLLEHLSKFEL